MKTTSLILLLATLGGLAAQDVPLQRPEERLATRKQTEAIYDAVRPVARDASASTLWVWTNRKHVAMATVIGDGTQALTKWSEIAFARGPIQVVGGDGRTADASVLGVYEDEDVALLQLDGARFTPVTWTDDEPTVGKFLVAAAPDDSPLSVGVASVNARSLRESDLAYVGVVLDGRHDGAGVLIREIDPESGSAEAGVRPGDVLLSVDGREVGSALELRNALLEYRPEDTAELALERDGETLELAVELGRRPQFQGVPEGRLKLMRRMGGPVSMRGGNFPYALQTDMQLMPNQVGGPVVNLDGESVGITIARTDRTRSFILPASRITEMLGRKPTDQTLAELPAQRRRQAMQRRARSTPRAIPMNPGAADRMRRHLEDMSGLLRRMDREMERFERE